MSRATQTSSWLFHAASALALFACTAEAPDDDSATSSALTAASAHRTVTLITGDRVTLGAGGPVITPGRGRERMGFSVTQNGANVYVTPSDAVPLIARGQLEPALFDVTRLLAYGYGDDKRADLPLIVSGATASGFAPQLAGLTPRSRLRSMHAATIHQPKATASLAQLTAPAFTGGAPAKIWLSHKRKPMLDHSVPQIGADVAHARGFTGAGVVVAVIDTGIDFNHPDLVGQVLDSRNFTDDGGDGNDVLSHGTHVASIIAGTGAASGGQFRGVAPDAKLVNARVCVPDDCPDEFNVDGFEWAVLEKHAPIVSVSLGELDSPGPDFMEEAVNQLSAEFGTLFVIAGGNDGDDHTAWSPSTADAALSVAAIDRDDHLAVFSSRGPRSDDATIKPELAAPGVDIVAARTHHVDPIGEPVGNDYMSLSGTSMATPHVSGAAALLKQQHPEWTGGQIKAQLVGTAKHLDERVVAVGAGRLDIDRGTRQTVTAEIATLNFGTARFPHADDPPNVRILAYHNAGTAPVTLAVSASIATATGAPGTVSVAPASLTIPAGGDGRVAITITTSGAGTDGDYAGLVTAAGGDVQVTTPIAIRREVESYDVTFHAIDDRGAPGTAFIRASTGNALVDSVLASPGATLRLPAGPYALDATLASALDRLAVLALPRLQLGADRTITLDARVARTPRVSVPGPAQTVLGSGAAYSDRATGHQFRAQNVGAVAIAQLGPDLPANELRGAATITLVDNLDAPTALTQLAHVERGHLVRNWNEAIRRDQLAQVTAVHANDGGDFLLVQSIPYTRDSDESLGGAFPIFLQGAAFTLDERYDARLRWLTDANTDGGNQNMVSRQLRSYAGGSHGVELWGRAPFGPAFPAQLVLDDNNDVAPTGRASRAGDTLTLQPALFAAQGDRDASSTVDTQRITLTRDGETLVDTSATDPLLLPPVDVPAGAATYRFAHTATRPGAALSSAVSAAWTFRSSRGDSVLPLPVVRFAPLLDLQNTAHGRALALPIRVERPAGAARPAITQLRVEASFDDGATWTRVPVIGSEVALALVVHPAGASAVSLRAIAEDRRGNRVEQDIIRAYRVAP